MNNVTINISGDLHIHFGDDVLSDLLPDDPVSEDADGIPEDFEDDEIDPAGILISVGGLPEDVDREIVESILTATAELLNEEVRETMARRKDEAHERV